MGAYTDRICSASTVRERFLDDRSSRRASECHVNKAFSPILADGQRKAHISLDDIHESPSFASTTKSSRRFGHGLSKDADSPPELPLLRMSSFPDMMAAASLSLSSCTPESTPLTMSDSFTISDTSSFQGLVGFASEFPQPPSLSPALRRMQSAPWLKELNAMFDASECSSWRRASQATERSREIDIQFSLGAAELSVPRTTLNLADLEKGSPLDRLRQETREISLSKRQTYKTRTTDDLLEWSKSNKSQDLSTASSQLPGKRNRTESSPAVPATLRQASSKRDGRRNTVSSVTTPDPSQRLLNKPRTIRKVASMQSDSKGKPLHEGGVTQRSIPKIKSLRLFPPTTNSKRDGKTHASSESGGNSTSTPLPAAKPRNWPFLRPSSTTKLPKSDYKPTGKHQSRGSRSSVDVTTIGDRTGKISRSDRTPYPLEQRLSGEHASSQRGSKLYTLQRKGRKQFRESAPHLPGLGLTSYGGLVGSKSTVGLGLEHTSSPEGLDGPFTLRRSRTSAALKRESEGYLDHSDRHGLTSTSVETSTSFMDITPERDVKLDQQPAVAEQKRDRVKRFIAKASSGFMEWSRALAKGASSKGQTPRPAKGTL